MRIVVDPKGIVRHVHLYYRDGDEVKIAAAVDEVLAATKPSPSPAR